MVRELSNYGSKRIICFIDNTFKSLPEQLLGTFGIDVTYIKAATSQTYNTTTGEVSGSDTNVSESILVMLLDQFMKAQVRQMI